MQQTTNSATPRSLNNILVTGGAGFIGSNFIRYLFGLGALDPFEQRQFKGRVINLDVLTYAGNLLNLVDVEEAFGLTGQSQSDVRYFFEQADISDRQAIELVFAKYQIDTVVHFAAESHVDRSIHGPEAFVKTNVFGTFTLLDVARHYWKDRSDVLFHQVSTDEVYGSLGETGFFYEDTAYDPRSPYSATKAASDHLVMAYSHTYHMPVTLSNCSNNYGPFQFPEKLIPVMILNMLEAKPLPVYGDGKNIRDWLYVEDHNSAVWAIMNRGRLGQCYNIGGENEWENIRLLKALIGIVARQTGKSDADLNSLISYVKDRPGHDRRYAINCDKLKGELGWRQSLSFEEGLEKTVAWYLGNHEWLALVKSGVYRTWMEQNYQSR